MNFGVGITLVHFAARFSVWFRVSGFRFRVLGFGFRVSGLKRRGVRCRANLANTRQSEPDSGPDSQAKVFQTCQAVTLRSTAARDLGACRNRPESLLTNSPGHLWRDKWTALSGPLSVSTVFVRERLNCICPCEGENRSCLTPFMHLNWGCV